MWPLAWKPEISRVGAVLVNRLTGAYSIDPGQAVIATYLAPPIQTAEGQKTGYYNNQKETGR
ncbi:hypothetical protein [Desulfofundulus thermosubterraneus]|uniref:hypothetical protein n=1 Tax=Desulfofundulus thermosubterraneus TaxID=348840 RepID=UPI00104206B4|nr:hypothetical protein [Desulfofundulus thermosubterraneus]